jgi:hypothetical protein
MFATFLRFGAKALEAGEEAGGISRFVAAKGRLREEEVEGAALLDGWVDFVATARCVAALAVLVLREVLVEGT